MEKLTTFITNTIKKLKMGNNFYKTGVHIRSVKSMFNFIINHCKYWTTYPFTIIKSIANNIEDFELNTNKDLSSIDIKPLQLAIKSRIKQFQEDQPGYNVFAYDKYLILYCNTADIPNRRTILPSYYLNYDNYDEWKRDIKLAHKKVKDYFYELKYLTMLIREFDLLCDDIRNLCRKYL